HLLEQLRALAELLPAHHRLHTFSISVHTGVSCECLFHAVPHSSTKASSGGTPASCSSHASFQCIRCRRSVPTWPPSSSSRRSRLRMPYLSRMLNIDADDACRRCLSAVTITRRLSFCTGGNAANNSSSRHRRPLWARMLVNATERPRARLRALG